MVAKQILLAFLIGVLLTILGLEIRDALMRPAVTAPTSDEEESAPEDNIHHLIHDTDVLKV